MSIFYNRSNAKQCEACKMWSPGASPSKKFKAGSSPQHAENNIVRGYIHSVSPVKVSARNTKYFNFVVQTDRDEYHHGVSFAPEKQAVFLAASQRSQGTELSNVRRVPSKCKCHGSVCAR